VDVRRRCHQRTLAHRPCCRLGTQANRGGIQPLARPRGAVQSTATHTASPHHSSLHKHTRAVSPAPTQPKIPMRRDTAARFSDRNESRLRVSKKKIT
jgi:hypothetical protein